MIKFREWILLRERKKKKKGLKLTLNVEGEPTVVGKSNEAVIGRQGEWVSYADKLHR